jgi:hypothetical protein
MKRNRKTALITILIFAISCVLTLCAFADGTPTLYAEVSSPSENGVIELNISLENVNFIAYGLAFKYDKETVAPVSSDGSETESFGAFSKFDRYEDFNFIGEKLDAQKGYFSYTSFITPNAENENIKSGEAQITGKTHAATFRFKKISDKDANFEIASIYNGDVYDETFVDGAAFTDKNGNLPVKIIIIEGPDKTKETQSVKYLYSQINPPDFSKEDRLKDTLYFVDGDYACAFEGELTAIDSDKNVKPYTDESGTRFLPLRFACERFGANVGWDDGTRTAKVKTASGKTAKIRIDEGLVEIGEKTVSADVRLEFSRTMLPEELIAEILDANIYKNANNTKECVLYGGIVPWKEDRQAEKDALDAMRYVMMPLFRSFI